MLLAGSKADLSYKRTVNKDVAEVKSEVINSIKYFEVSAKNDDPSINTMFDTLVKDILDKSKFHPQAEDDSVSTPDIIPVLSTARNEMSTETGCCCIC